MSQCRIHSGPVVLSHRLSSS